MKDWENIIQISSNEYHTVGLKDDGSVVSTSVNTSNDTGQAEVDSWSDIVQ
ncbi:RCC1 domain-containing protein [[Clostridium] innocuum]|nr:RCC1 domain-containing protein [[Clostridium] innocuum]